MVSIAGYRLAAGAFAVLASVQDNAVRPQREAVATGLGGPGLDVGPHVDTRPLAIRSLPYGGFKLRSYFDDLYNQVYFLPAIVDFGTISGPTTRGVVVWNAHLHAVRLNSVGLRNVSGVTVDGEALPHDFPALALTTYSFTAVDDPEITLSGFADFAFTPTELHSLKLIGTRAVLAPWVPNWRESYTVAYEFKTDIFTTRAGREQRRALRQTPRKTLEFTASFVRGKGREFLRLMAARQNASLLIAEETRRVRSTAEMVAGSSIMAVSSTPDWLANGTSVVLAYGEQREVQRVSGTSDAGIAFLGSTLKTWPAGTFVYAARRGLVASSIAASLKTSTVQEAPIVFNVNPGSEELVDVPAASTTFNGREVWLGRPNWGDDLSLEYARVRELIDFGQGRIATNSPVPFGTRNFTATFHGRNDAAVRDIENFFLRMKGQRGEFYMPSWTSDIAIKVTSAAGSKVMRIEGTDFYADYNGDTVQRAIGVLRKDGTWIFNRVESIGQISDNLGDDSAVQVVDPWPVDVRPDNVRMICWLPVWRLAADTLTVEWLTAEVAQTTLVMMTLEDLP